jgi:chromosome partitioning protein
MGFIYTIANQKGGVGKTTSTINLGAYLAYYGKNVLLVDVDPQSNATSSVGIDKQAVRGGTYQALLEDGNIRDYILIDCPPSLGLLTLNGLVAAVDGILIPVQCEYLAMEGLGDLIATIERVRRVISPDLTVRGVILTMFDSRTNLANDVVEEVKKHFEDKVFDSIVPRSVRLAEAPSYGVPISLYSPGSIGAKAYQELAKELLLGDGHQLPAV